MKILATAREAGNWHKLSVLFEGRYWIDGPFKERWRRGKNRFVLFSGWNDKQKWQFMDLLVAKSVPMKLYSLYDAMESLSIKDETPMCFIVKSDCSTDGLIVGRTTIRTFIELSWRAKLWGRELLLRESVTTVTATLKNANVFDIYCILEVTLTQVQLEILLVIFGFALMRMTK